MKEREINEAVARKLGWKNHDRTCEQPTPGASIYTHGDHWYQKGCFCREKMPDYCHSIAAAWEIVEKYKFRLSPVNETEWVAQGMGNMVKADTAPMAICLAFLKIQ